MVLKTYSQFMNMKYVHVFCYFQFSSKYQQPWLEARRSVPTCHNHIPQLTTLFFNLIHPLSSTMARGSDGKAARKKKRAEARAEETERILAGESPDVVNEFDAPPSFDDVVADDKSSSDEDDDEADRAEEETRADPEKTPEKKKKSKSARAKKKAAAAAASRRSRGGGDGCDADGPCCGPSGRAGGSGEGIKTLPLVMLVMLTATTVLPALLYMGDWLGNYMQRAHIMGNLGHRLGIGPSPKKRVLSFYEKHDPEKIGEVPKILSKYYGDYPKLIKRLERKYQDYGYFLHWEGKYKYRQISFA